MYKGGTLLEAMFEKKLDANIRKELIKKYPEFTKGDYTGNLVYATREEKDIILIMANMETGEVTIFDCELYGVAEVSLQIRQ